MKFAILIAVCMLALVAAQAPDVAIVEHDINGGSPITSGGSLNIPMGSGTPGKSWEVLAGNTITKTDISISGVAAQNIVASAGTASFGTTNTITLSFDGTGSSPGTRLRFVVPAGTFRTTDQAFVNTEFTIDLLIKNTGLTNHYGQVSISAFSPALGSTVSLHDSGVSIRLNKDTIVAVFDRAVVPKAGASINLKANGDCGGTACAEVTYLLQTTTAFNSATVGTSVDVDGETFTNEISFKITDDEFFAKGKVISTNSPFSSLVQAVAHSTSTAISPTGTYFGVNIIGDACDARNAFNDARDGCQCTIDIESLDTSLPTNLESATTTLTGGVLTISYTESVKYQHLDPTKPDINFMGADGSASPAACINAFTWNAATENSDCTRTWTGTINANDFFNGVGDVANDKCKFEVISETTDPNTDILIRFQITNKETVEALYDDLNDHANYLSRTLTHLMPFRLAFPKTVEVSDTVTVYSAINVLRALVQQTTLNNAVTTGSKLTVNVLTNANVPYKMSLGSTTTEETGVSLVGGAWAEVASPAGLTCDDTTGNCEQLWTADFTLDDIGTKCTYSGTYSFDLVVGCRTVSGTPCPVGAPGKVVTVTLELETANVCAVTSESVGLTATATRTLSDYTTATSGVVDHQQPVYFKIDVGTVANSAVVKHADILVLKAYESNDAGTEYVIFSATGTPAVTTTNFNPSVFRGTNANPTDPTSPATPTATFTVRTDDLGLAGSDQGDFVLTFTLAAVYNFDQAASVDREFAVMRSHRLFNGVGQRNIGESTEATISMGAQSTFDDTPATEVTTQEEGSHVNGANGIFVAAGVVAIACVAAAFVAVVRLQQAKKRAAAKSAEINMA